MLKYAGLILVFSILCSILTAQIYDGGKWPKQPQSKMYFDKPGSYDMVVECEKRVLDQRDSFKIDAYFTGYGQILASKVYITFGGDIIDTSSYGLTSMSMEEGRIWWGKIKVPVKYHAKTNTIVITMSGVGFPDSLGKESISSYIDSDQDSGHFLIMTEMNLENAPISLKLKLRDGVTPGLYEIAFYYTYFNGLEWKSAKVEIPIKVNSFGETHADQLIYAGLILAGIAVLPVIGPIFAPYSRLIKRVRERWRMRKLKKRLRKPIVGRQK
ncbi:MAG: hypothetical protein JWQ27_2689 [Ferruginibacter sp.]|nr:hypothetical protein [Ferruginibacter sp.]